jgi:hypothetical protein
VPTYDELARLCAKQAWLTHDQLTARELWRLPRDYQESAAKLDSSTLPDIGSPPGGLGPP